MATVYLTAEQQKENRNLLKKKHKREWRKWLQKE